MTLETTSFTYILESLLIFNRNLHHAIFSRSRPHNLRTGFNLLVPSHTKIYLETLITVSELQIVIWQDDGQIQEQLVERELRMEEGWGTPKEGSV